MIPNFLNSKTKESVSPKSSGSTGIQVILCAGEILMSCIALILKYKYSIKIFDSYQDRITNFCSVMQIIQFLSFCFFVMYIDSRIYRPPPPHRPALPPTAPVTHSVNEGRKWVVYFLQ